MSRRLAIVHWMPVEMYPPTMNIARYFGDHGWDVTIHTTRNRHALPDFAHGGVSVHRAPTPTGRARLMRAGITAGFHAATAMRLLGERPDAILYFEPQSSFPVLVSEMLRDVPLFIHHHEYHEPREFEEEGMRLARVFHRLEQSRLFSRARWISHTNPARLELFLRDNPGVNPAIGRVFPNLAPAAWSRERNTTWISSPPPPLRLVYVGSLSRRDTYIAELIGWIRSRAQGTVTLDVFSYNVDEDTQSFLAKAVADTEPGDKNVVRWFREGLSYDDLPERLRGYHTGVILYRASTLNYRHNASNKLFEYLACGLDVVYPSRMLGVKPYARTDMAPRVIEVDFENIEALDIAVLSHRGAIPEEPFSEGAESAIAKLESAMIDAVENA